MKMEKHVQEEFLPLKVFPDILPEIVSAKKKGQTHKKKIPSAHLAFFGFI